jgi:glycosyl transferase family 2
MRLAMTLLVRDGADLIDDNLRYHRAQGVDLFVIGDNGSTDGSVEILERYERAGLIDLERIPGGAREAQGDGRTKLARRALELGADWVIHNDQDEFWWPAGGGDLKEALAAIPDRFGLVLAPRSEFVGRPGDGYFADRLTIREAHFRRPPKTAHRAHAQVMISQPHPTHIWVDYGAPPRQGLVGRPVRRAQAEHGEAAELDLLLAPMFPLAVRHFPLRSFGQYRHMVELALANDQLREGNRVRKAFEEGQLEEVYSDLILDDVAVKRGLTEGWLVDDTDFRDYLAACPQLLDGGGTPPPGARAWSEERRSRELAALEADAMYALSRYLQANAYKLQTRHHEGAERRAAKRQLERRLQRVRERLRHQRERRRRIESSRWWRLRPRLPRALSGRREASTRRHR